MVVALILMSSSGISITAARQLFISGITGLILGFCKQIVVSIFYVDNQMPPRRQQKMLKMTPAQCRAARALLNWTQPKLANEAGFGLSTIVDYEKERRLVSTAAHLSRPPSGNRCAHTHR